MPAIPWVCCPGRCLLELRVFLSSWWCGCSESWDSVWPWTTDIKPWTWRQAGDPGFYTIWPLSSFTTPGEVGKRRTERAGPLATPPEVSIRGPRLGLHFGVIRSLSRQLCQPPMGTTLGLLIYPQIPATHPSHAILFRKYCHLLRQLIPRFCHSGDLGSGLTSWYEFGQVTGTLPSVISCVCHPSPSGSSGVGFGPGLCQTPVLTLVYSG